MQRKGLPVCLNYPTHRPQRNPRTPRVCVCVCLLACVCVFLSGLSPSNGARRLRVVTHYRGACLGRHTLVGISACLLVSRAAPTCRLTPPPPAPPALILTEKPQIFQAGKTRWTFCGMWPFRSLIVWSKLRDTVISFFSRLPCLHTPSLVCLPSPFLRPR